jgi:hypothetical protein
VSKRPLKRGPGYMGGHSVVCSCHECKRRAQESRKEANRKDRHRPAALEAQRFRDEGLAVEGAGFDTEPAPSVKRLREIAGLSSAASRYAPAADALREAALRLMERAPLEDKTPALCIDLRKRWEHDFRFGAPSRDVAVLDRLLWHLPEEVEWSWLAVESGRYGNRELRALHKVVQGYLLDALEQRSALCWDLRLDEDGQPIWEVVVAGWNRAFFGSPRTRIPNDPLTRGRFSIPAIRAELERAANANRMEYADFVAPFGRGPTPKGQTHRRAELSKVLHKIARRGARHEQIRFVLGWPSRDSVSRMIQKRRNPLKNVTDET